MGTHLHLLRGWWTGVRGPPWALPGGGDKCMKRIVEQAPAGNTKPLAADDGTGHLKVGHG